MTIAAILLAAESARTGGEAVALAPSDDGETLVEWQIAELLEAGVNVVEVVLGCDAERIIPLVAADNVEPIVHSGWEHDHAGGVRIGATAVPRDTNTAIIVDIARPARRAHLLGAPRSARGDRRFRDARGITRCRWVRPSLSTRRAGGAAQRHRRTRRVRGCAAAARPAVAQGSMRARRRLRSSEAGAGRTRCSAAGRGASAADATPCLRADHSRRTRRSRRRTRRLTSTP